jgi:hydrogenase maturation protein HypF
MRPFHLPGGEKAGREPWRSAASLCWETGYPTPSMTQESELLFEAWRRRINAPATSAVGRLFDAAAALTGVCTRSSFEGQGPMMLEALVDKTGNSIELPLDNRDDFLITNWEPLLPALLDSNLTVADRAACFHASMAQAMLQQARKIRSRHGVNTIGFSGGVFQNRVLTEHAMELLSSDGFSVHLPEMIPVNDAGISFGQVIEYGFSR